MIGGLGSFANTEEWVERAICSQVDPELFFPDIGKSTVDARRICADCPVRKECLTYALENNEMHGTWGGVAARDRAKMRRVRRAA